MKVLFDSIGTKEHHHRNYSHFGGISIWNTHRKITKFLYCDLSSVEGLFWYYKVYYLGFSFYHWVHIYPHLYFERWCSCCESSSWIQKYFASSPSESNRMNETFLSWFLNAATINLRMSRGGRLLLNVKPKGYELVEHIATKVEVNTRILSTSKNEKFIWIMKPGGILRHQWLNLWKF